MWKRGSVCNILISKLRDYAIGEKEEDEKEKPYN